MKIKTELRSFLGLANQLGKFMPDLAHSTVKIKELMKEKNVFLWTDEHEKEFQALKKVLMNTLSRKDFLDFVWLSPTIGLFLLI